MKILNVGVVGATGMVGEAFLNILTEKKFPLGELRPFASDKSVGQNVSCCGRSFAVQALSANCFRGLDLVFFSSGDDISAEWAPRAVADGAFAIDNSAAFRMHPEHPLVVPEVNGHLLPQPTKPALIANPNCSTIQLVVALQALRDLDLESVHVASYQAVSGAGKAGREELMTQTRAILDQKASPKPETFAHPIAFNCIPHIGSFNENGFCSEEIKIMKETKKIMGLPQLRVSAFTVRIPALNSHSEAVWVRFKKPTTRKDVESRLSSALGLTYVPQTEPQNYPTALQASGKDPVYVGRLHQDLDDPQTWIFWVVADNILKGAALNGLQIAQKIYSLNAL